MRDIFLNWLRWAINNVGDGYFGHSERVYCYELYHLIRVKMHLYERQNGRLNEVFLHSELVKRIITRADAEFYEVWPLNERRIPDFLFHSPGDFNNQIATIEVKAVHLHQKEFYEDLRKLTDMINNYQYQLGIFHCINNSKERIVELLGKDLDFIGNFNGNIILIIKSNFYSEIEQYTLAELIEEINLTRNGM